MAAVNELAYPSGASLYLRMKWEEKTLATGTGFIVQRAGSTYLVTNRHNLSGRRSDTNEFIDELWLTPTHVEIQHHAANQLGHWRQVLEPLVDDNDLPRWYEHPRFGRMVDVVALPLQRTHGVDIYPYDPWTVGPALRAGVSDMVSIIGFPFDLSAGGWPVWSKGAIASETFVDVDGLPMFYIDSRTRKGQSGSPVIAYCHSGMCEMDDRSSMMFEFPVHRFLGVYSGRVHPESDLGIVWKATAVQDIIDGRLRQAAG